MSYKNSSLYAAKVYAEHPSTLWSLDEDVTFKSLLSDAQKTIASPSWTITGLTSASANISGVPITGSTVRTVYPTSSSSTMYMSLASAISATTNIDSRKNSICFGAYAHIQSSAYVNFLKIRIGVSVSGTEYYTEYTKDKFIQEVWTKLEYTKDLTGVSSFTPFIRVYFSQPVSGQSLGVSFSSLSCGQWSEPYNSYSSGATYVNIPSSISNLFGYTGTLSGVPLDPYGLDNSASAYSVDLSNRLLAVSSGIPMVYGSKKNMSILQRDDFDAFDTYLDGGIVGTQYDNILHDGGTASVNPGVGFDGGAPSTTSQTFNTPSLIFKSKGFLNKSGYNKNITAEFWMRIENLSVSEVRIMGPLASDDGLYVDGNYIVVKVGKYKRSYFIGQWYRPMLVHFSQTPSEISLMINAEKVISIPINTLSNFNFPSSDQDYVGFFGENHIPLFEIDAFSIFPYLVSEPVAKKRFVLGQGVTQQENIAVANGSDITYIDFPFSGYMSNLSLPNKEPWTNAYFNNLNVSTDGIELPTYNLPNIIFNKGTSSLSDEAALSIYSKFEEDNFAIQDSSENFIKLRPKTTYNVFNPTIYFSKVNRLKSPTETIHALLELDSDILTEQSLLYFYNNFNTNYFEVKIISGSLQYIYNDETLYAEQVVANSNICVGIKIDDLINEFQQIGTFFDNNDAVSLNFAGRENKVFLGKIFSLTFNDSFYSQLDSLLIFDINGIAISDYSNFSYIGAYTLLPTLSNISVYFDIAARGYWESSYPLSYFGKSITTASGTKLYDLDMLQFNIDVPAPSYYIPDSYSEEYFDYSNVKVYLSMQNTASVGQVLYSELSNTENIRNRRIINLDSLNNTATTKFEICDNTVIFPPKTNVDFNHYHITIHIEVSTKGINTEKTKVKKMSLSSLAYDELSLFSIKTPTARSINPISKSGSTTLYKQNNPFVINIETAPYLYINGKNGISVISSSAQITNTVSFIVNENLKQGYEFIGLQTYLMYNKAATFSGDETLSSVYGSDGKQYNIRVYPESDNKRGIIKVIDASTSLELDGCNFYLNGNKVSKITMRPLEWIFILITFPTDINKKGIVAVPGSVDFYPGVSVNNVAVFDKSLTKDTIIEVADSWQIALSSGSITWQTFLDTKITWSAAYNGSTRSTGERIDGVSVFNSYSGVSSMVNEDSGKIKVKFDSLSVINDVTWSGFEVYNI